MFFPIIGKNIYETFCGSIDIPDKAGRHVTIKAFYGSYATEPIYWVVLRDLKHTLLSTVKVKVPMQMDIENKILHN